VTILALKKVRKKLLQTGARLGVNPNTPLSHANTPSPYLPWYGRDVVIEHTVPVSNVNMPRFNVNTPSLVCQEMAPVRVGQGLRVDPNPNPFLTYTPFPCFYQGMAEMLVIEHTVPVSRF